MIFLLATSTREFTGGATWSNGELLAHWWMVKTTRTNSCYACHPNYPKTGENTAANNISIGFSIFSIFSHETWDILRWCTGRQPNNMWINLIYIFCHSNIAIAISILPSGKHTKHIKKRWKITMLLMGKSTISMAMASIANCHAESPGVSHPHRWSRYWRLPCARRTPGGIFFGWHGPHMATSIIILK